MGSLPVKYSFWTSITKSARFGFSAITLIVGLQRQCLQPLMENRLGLWYLAWPTRRIQSISSGVIGPLSKASSAAVRSETDLGPVRQRSTAGFVKLNR